MSERLKYKITANSVTLLRSIFTQAQTWTTREPDTAQTRYDVYFPDRSLRQSLWGLGARLKIRKGCEFTNGALLGVYPGGTAHKGGNSSGWKNWLSLVLWPLPRDTHGTIELSWSGSMWCKIRPGLRQLHGSTDGLIKVTCPGTSGRCSRQFVIGPKGTPYDVTLIYPYAGDKSHTRSLQ